MKPFERISFYSFWSQVWRDVCSDLQGASECFALLKFDAAQGYWTMVRARELTMRMGTRMAWSVPRLVKLLNFLLRLDAYMRESEIG